jgi:hypothetical protein
VSLIQNLKLATILLNQRDLALVEAAKQVGKQQRANGDD